MRRLGGVPEPERQDELTEGERRDLVRLLVDGARKVIEKRRADAPQPASSSTSPRTNKAS
jgi:hypothetical protein